MYQQTIRTAFSRELMRQKSNGLQLIPKDAMKPTCVYLYASEDTAKNEAAHWCNIKFVIRI